jgi:cysteine-rich repeat protein/probable HAF family extracellular repeat protein
MRALLILVVGLVVVGAFLLPSHPAYAEPMFMGLGDLGGTFPYSFARGVSADGSVIVGTSSSASGSEAFRWTAAGGMEGLGDLEGGLFSSGAWAMSADGSVIVGYCRSASGAEACIWDATGRLLELDQVLVSNFGLDLTGWTLERATGISDDGLTIVGFGTDPSGYTEAWIAVLGPPCGNGIVGGSEECDDGDITPGDGCDASCQIETGWICEGEPSVCTTQLPTLSPWSQLALMAGLLGAGLSVGGRRLHTHRARTK